MRQSDRRGAVFMDYRNSIDTFNKNTIIYGHNYLDSTMLSDLENYKDKALSVPELMVKSLILRTSWSVWAAG